MNYIIFHVEKKAVFFLISGRNKKIRENWYFLLFNVRIARYYNNVIYC